MLLEKRVRITEIVLYLAFIGGILMSFPLWISDRMFPQVPVADSLFPFPSPLDYLIAYGLVATLAVNCFLRKPWLNMVFLVLLWLLLIRDQNRWHSWVYMYIMLLVPFTLRSKFNNETILQYLRLLLIGVYLWSGIHKINPTFPHVSFMLVVTKLFRITDPAMVESILPFGYMVSVVEIVMAVLLIFGRTRLAGIILVLSSHVLILAFISPLGMDYNYVVVPWNMAMMVFVVAAFYGTRDNIWPVLTGLLRWQLALVYLFVWLLPVLNFWGYWDSSFSFQLYANKEERLFIAVSDKQLHKIDRSLLKYTVPLSAVPDGKVIDVNEWSMGELNVPINYERRVFRHVARYFCNLGIDDGYMFMLLFTQHGKEPKFQPVQCNEVDNVLR